MCLYSNRVHVIKATLICYKLQLLMLLMTANLQVIIDDVIILYIGHDGDAIYAKKHSIDSSYEAHMQIKNPEFSLIKEKVVIANLGIR